MSQISSNSYKEWLHTSIQDGSINCCPESDITLDLKHIGLGSFGVVYKATVTAGSSFEITTRTMLDEWHNHFSGMTVAVKILNSDNGDCEEDLHRQFVKEVAYHFLLCSLRSYLRLD